MVITLPPRCAVCLRILLALSSAALAGLAALRWFSPEGTGFIPPAAAAAALCWCAFLAPQAVCGSFRAELSRGRLTVGRGLLLRRLTVLPVRQTVRAEAVTSPVGRLLRLSTLVLRTPSGAVRLRFLDSADAGALREALTADIAPEQAAAAEAVPEKQPERAAGEFIGCRRPRRERNGRREYIPAGGEARAY